MTRIKTVFMGTPAFALPTLQALHQDSRIELSGVLTQPDRPAGRGKMFKPPPVKEFALEQGIDFIQPPNLKDDEVVPWLKNHQPDVITVVAYGGFVLKPVRKLPPHGCINLHPSLLPKYRGAAPMQWTLINGDTVTGNTIIFLSKGWDDGDIILQEREPVYENDTYDSLSARLSQSGAALMVRALHSIADGTATRTPQPEEGVVFAPLLSNEDARIDWNKPAAAIHNHIRGLCSIPGAFTHYQDQRWKIYRTAALSEPANAVPGTIISTAFNTIRVAAKDSVLEILELQPAGKKRMIAADFLRGYPVKTGVQLT